MKASTGKQPLYPTTPDGRYFVVRGRLWRCSNPNLPEPQRKTLVAQLMKARRAKGVAIKAGDDHAREEAKEDINAAKEALGERGAVWWSENVPDYNRHLVANTPYAQWFNSLDKSSA